MKPAKKRAIGSIFRPWGVIVAIGLIYGKRCYVLRDELGELTLMPASVVEAA